METVKKGLINGSKARWNLTEFYMRRKGKAYFRNEYGKTVTSGFSNKQLDALIYGKKYQFKITNLIGSNGEILATKDLHNKK